MHNERVSLRHEFDYPRKAFASLLMHVLLRRLFCYLSVQVKFATSLSIRSLGLINNSLKGILKIISFQQSDSTVDR